MDGLSGAQTWCAYGVFAHNSVKISALIADAQPARPTPRNTPRNTSGQPRPRATGPPSRSSPTPPPTLLVPT
jgi:hypothetical protein